MTRAHEPETVDQQTQAAKSASVSVQFGLERMLTRLNIADSTPLRIGRDGRYLLSACLGRGAMGEVYLARDRVLRRDVALKIVAPRFRHSARSRRRLLREARALAALQHPNVLEVYDVDTAASGELFLAMAYVPGQTLQRWQEGKPLSALLPVYVSAGQGLAAAHASGIVHRDFKPANVLISDSPERVVVGDFGLAGSPVPSSSESLPSSNELQDDDATITAPGALLGTPAYMAPELFAGQPASMASDQYAFCTALWEAVTGSLPFVQPRSSTQPVPARPSTMPRWLYRALARGLDAEPDRRFPDMPSLLAQLTRGQRRPRAVAMTVVGALVLAGGLGSGLLKGPVDPCSSIDEQVDKVWNEDARARIARLSESRRLPIMPWRSSTPLSSAGVPTRPRLAKHCRSSPRIPKPSPCRSVIVGGSRASKAGCSSSSIRPPGCCATCSTGSSRSIARTIPARFRRQSSMPTFKPRSNRSKSSTRNASSPARSSSRRRP
ncbi:MAG: serine/threonine protein kinase [Deltaproteobacteria bacterium]|nr:serine/threonine protein kinase [Deltaproteobacteria bacterium]